MLSLFRHATKLPSRGSTDGSVNHSVAKSQDTRDTMVNATDEVGLPSDNSRNRMDEKVEELDADKGACVGQLMDGEIEIVEDSSKNGDKILHTVVVNDENDDGSIETNSGAEKGLRRSKRKRMRPKDFMNDEDDDDDNSNDNSTRERAKARVRRDQRKKQRKEEEQRRLKEEAKRQKEREREELKKQKELKKLELMKIREEEKLKKEEEKRKRDEAKRLQKEKERQEREEEKRKREEAKRLQREEEKRKREEEKLKREEEKKLQQEAKEKSQLRIGNFFTKKVSILKQTTRQSDYEKHFLPFYTRGNVVLSSFLNLSKEDLEASKRKIDGELSKATMGGEVEDTSGENSILQWLKSREVKRGHHIQYQAVTLLQQMTSQEKTDQELEILLSMIPQKYIKFYENVRPPYIGTYSKDVVLPVDNPFSKDGTGYNYEYDSDLEWANEEENDEGGGVEDLESGEDEEDDEEDEASEDEFEGFLENEDGSGKLSDGKGKRKFVGPLIPKVLLRRDIDQMSPEDRSMFDKLSAQCLIEGCKFPIVPFSPIISQQKKKQEEGTVTGENEKVSPSLVQPLKPDLSTGTTKEEQRQQVQLITEPEDLLKLFNEVEGSTFSLATVTEISQRSLPHYNKKIIKNTVKQYAVRSGPNGPDLSARKWVIKDRKFLQALHDRVAQVTKNGT